MDKLHTLYYFLDLAGTFVFAVSGVTAAKQRGLDLFGICAIAFTVACGGGIVHDLCISAIPPAGLTNWYYLVVAIIAGITIGLYPYVQRLNQPVIFFDALGYWAYVTTGTCPFIQMIKQNEIYKSSTIRLTLGNNIYSVIRNFFR
jgi:uncharacterized membrane protein YeiH